jgi:hypothetical protein
MTQDKQSAAIARYRAMAGLIKKLPPKAARRARADRKRYAARYVLQRRGRAVCEPVRMVRFLVHVCGLTMRDASKAVRTALRNNECGAWPAAKSADGMAAEIYRRTGDMPDAMSMARFLGWASPAPQIWETVRVTLSGMTVAPENTGAADWPQALESAGKENGS